MKLPKEFFIIFAQIKDRRQLYIGLAAAILSAAMVAFIPYLYGRLADIAVRPDSQLKTIGGLVLLWLALSFASDFLSRRSDRYAYEISTDVTNNLLVDLFYHLSNLPIRFHKERKIGRIARRAQRGIDELYNFIESTIFDFLPAVFSLIVAMAVLFFVEWRLALILVAASFSYVLLTFFWTKGIVKKQKTMHAGWEKAYGQLFDSLQNIQAVKAASAEEFERKRHTRNFMSAGRVYKNWRLLWTKMSFWQQTIFALSFIAVFVAGVMMLRSGRLTPGLLIMFVGYSSLLTSPLARLASQYRQAKTALSSFRRVMHYYRFVPENDLPSAKELQIRGQVVFEKVSFSYRRKDQLVLADVSFSIQPGQTVALVGASGVGKSTIVDLVGRYYLSQQGRILIDGVDIKKIKLKSLRSQVALVPQEVLLFNDTIQNNIRYGRLGAADQQVEAAARAANAHQFIESFSKQYNQIVGERGIKLSVGQKQRVAIARAILRDPKILILDEATSALDSVSEKLVQEALQKLIEGRTTFVVAHRLSTIQRADQIIVLAKGRIAEQGTHQELMQNPQGIYRNFWEMQSAMQAAV